MRKWLTCNRLLRRLQCAKCKSVPKQPIPVSPSRNSLRKAEKVNAVESSHLFDSDCSSALLSRQGHGDDYAKTIEQLEDLRKGQYLENLAGTMRRYRLSEHDNVTRNMKRIIGQGVQSKC